MSETVMDRWATWMTKGHRFTWFMGICALIYVGLVLGGGWFFSSHVKAAYGAKQSCQCVCQP